MRTNSDHISFLEYYLEEELHSENPNQELIREYTFLIDSYYKR